MASQTLIALVCLIFLLTSESLGGDLLDSLKELPEWKQFLEFMTKTDAKIESLSRMKHGSEVVFQAQHTGVPDIVKAPHVVIYDNVMVNKRLGYNRVTGKFTCRKNGLYFFGYSSLPTRGTRTDVVLMRDGSAVSGIHSHMTKTNTQVAMNSVILYLTKGDRVWVVVAKGSLWSPGRSLTFQGFHLPD